MEITNLVVGPVGNVPLDYIYDFDNPEHHEEYRADYSSGISSLMTNICEAVDNYPDKVTVDISDLSIVDHPEEDEYAVVIPKIVIFPELAAITMFYHKSIGKSLYDTVLKFTEKETPDLTVTDFDVLTTCVCLNDSKISNFGISTEHGTYQIDCIQVDDIVFYATESNGRKGRFSMRIIYIPDERNQDGEYESIATLISAMPIETTRDMFKNMNDLKSVLSPNALSYVMMSKGPKVKTSHNCFDVNYFRSTAKHCLDFLVMGTEGNSIN